MCNANKEIQSSSLKAYKETDKLKAEFIHLYFDKGLSVNDIKRDYPDKFNQADSTLYLWKKQEEERREKYREIDELWNISKSIEKGDSPEKTAYIIEFISLSGIVDFSVVMGDYIWQLSRYFDIKEDWKEQIIFAEYLSATEHLKEKYIHAYKLCNFAITQCMITPFKKTPGGITNWLRLVIDILFTVLTDKPNERTLEKVTQLLASLYNVQMIYYPNHIKEIDKEFHLNSISKITERVNFYRGWERILLTGIDTPDTADPTIMTKLDKERLAIIQLFHKKFIDERNRNLSIIENTSKRMDKLEKEEKNG